MKYSYDYLYVYDGPSLLDVQIASLTGILPEDIISSGPDIFLNFLSDDTETMDGFKIQYDAGKIFIFGNVIWSFYASISCSIFMTFLSLKDKILLPSEKLPLRY